jgi:hypothetical protein
LAVAVARASAVAAALGAAGGVARATKDTAHSELAAAT